MHDDLLTQLAQLQSIRVISRRSVLEYRDTVRNIREIGEALGADTILEGGVQTEIARAITSALHATLTTRESAHLAVMPTDNMAAYRAYHRAMDIRNSTEGFDYLDFRRALEEAVALDSTQASTFPGGLVQFPVCRDGSTGHKPAAISGDGPIL